MAARKFLIVAAEDWYFCSHRIPMAKAAQAIGFDVVVATRAGEHVDAINDMGFRHIRLRIFTRSNINIFRNIASIFELIWIYLRVKPSIVLHVSLKVTVFGLIAAYFSSLRLSINLLPGLGRLAVGEGGLIRISRAGLWFFLRRAFRRKGNLLVVQNQDNYDFFINRGIVPKDKIELIKGSGVDTNLFVPQPEAAGRPIAAFVGRMLWSKGIGDFVSAAEILQRRGVDVRVVLVGLPDYANWHCIPVENLKRWQQDRIVEWWGYQDDILSVWRQANIGVFPTYYGEGIPKALLEAGACARPVITTNMGGGRDLVSDAVSGLVVSPRDAHGLADAIQQLVEVPSDRKRFGARLREKVAESYNDESVAAATQSVIEKLMKTERSD